MTIASVAEGGNHRIQKFTRTGIFVKSVGGTDETGDSEHESIHDRKVAGACSEALRRLKTTSTAGREDQSVRGPPRMDSKTSLMVQSTFEQAWLTWEGGQVRMT